MTFKRSYFHSIDENQHGLIRFGDESLVIFEGKGSIMVNYSNGEELKLEGVLLVPTLKVNILSLRKLNDDNFTSYHMGRKRSVAVASLSLSSEFLCH